MGGASRQRPEDFDVYPHYFSLGIPILTFSCGFISQLKNPYGTRLQGLDYMHMSLRHSLLGGMIPTLLHFFLFLLFKNVLLQHPHIAHFLKSYPTACSPKEHGEGGGVMNKPELNSQNLNKICLHEAFFFGTLKCIHNFPSTSCSCILKLILQRSSSITFTMYWSNCLEVFFLVLWNASRFIHHLVIAFKSF